MKTIDRRNEIKYGMTKSKIADVLVVDGKVLSRFLKEIGIEHSYKLTPKEIELIKREWFG